MPRPCRRTQAATNPIRSRTRSSGRRPWGPQLHPVHRASAPSWRFPRSSAAACLPPFRAPCPQHLAPAGKAEWRRRASSSALLPAKPHRSEGGSREVHDDLHQPERSGGLCGVSWAPLKRRSGGATRPRSRGRFTADAGSPRPASIPSEPLFTFREEPYGTRGYRLRARLPS